MKMDPNILKATSITKFNIKGKTIYVKFIWKLDDDADDHTDNDVLFHIKIFDGDVTWSGKFTNESVKKYCDRCEETENQYIRHVMRYLKETVRHDVTYDFVVNRDNSELATFIWKKKFEGGSIVLVHGSVLVKLDKSVESKDLILDFLLEQNRELRNTIETLNGKNDTITLELKICKTELEKFVNIKTELEASLYGKFIQLLNAKKRRIQVLESNVHNISDSNNLSGDH